MGRLKNSDEDRTYNRVPTENFYKSGDENPLSGDESLLEKWESMGRKKFGLSRVYLIIVIAAICIFSLLVIYCFASAFSGSTSGSRVNPLSSAHSTDKLTNKQQVTTTQISFDQFGRMQSETTTETTGFDQDGHRVATRETKQGDAANQETEKMLGNLGPLAGILGAFMQPQRDPMMEMMHNLAEIAELQAGISAAEQVLHDHHEHNHPGVAFIPGIPHHGHEHHDSHEPGHEGHHHHNGHCCSQEHHTSAEPGHQGHHHHNGHCCQENHAKKPVELDVVAQPAED